MRKVFIQEKLKEIGFSVDDLNLGFYDQIGELTAKRQRGPDSDLFKKVGSFYRANYERAILQGCLIAKYKISSFLEIGTGRGYVSMCNGASMQMNGIDGKIITIDSDPNIQSYFDKLRGIFPYDWHKNILFVAGESSDVLSKINDSFDMIYIDGNHNYEYVKNDWKWAKEHFKEFVIFDDYNENNTNDDIQVKQLVDEIDKSGEFHLDLVKMDRRIFFDDRRIPDREINYGQVLVRKK